MVRLLDPATQQGLMYKLGLPSARALRCVLWMHLCRGEYSGHGAVHTSYSLTPSLKLFCRPYMVHCCFTEGVCAAWLCRMPGRGGDEIASMACEGCGSTCGAPETRLLQQALQVWQLAPRSSTGLWRRKRLLLH